MLQNGPIFSTRGIFQVLGITFNLVDHILNGLPRLLYFDCIHILQTLRKCLQVYVEHFFSLNVLLNTRCTL